MESVKARRPRLVIVSQVLPIPLKSGQQQRVYHMLKAMRPQFHTTFLTTAALGDSAVKIQEELEALCDDVILLPSQYARTRWTKWKHRLSGLSYIFRTGLKFSNYVIGEVEFEPNRLREVLEEEHFDCALFEYWHAVRSTAVFKEKGIPCVLDMHNVLWQAYDRQLTAKLFLPARWKKWALNQYRQQEERAWTQFEALVAINAAERDYTEARTPYHIPVFYAPMGIDLARWPYIHRPTYPPRLAYYGGLGSSHNQQDALHCFEYIMPIVWKTYPEAELWLVGNKPPASLRALAERDARVRVTGFVDQVQDVLRTMTALVCPWSGTYGFRSRLVEVMALGVPVIASPDAVYGMEMESGRGIFLENTFEDMAVTCLRLLKDPVFAKQQSKAARVQIEEKFSFEATYGRLARELADFVSQQQPTFFDCETDLHSHED